MIITYFSNRERQILELLLKNRDIPLRIYDIAQHLAVSSRTVHRELKRLKDSLSSFDIHLIREKKKGIFLNGDSHAFQTLKTHIASEVPNNLSLEERKVILLYALIQANEPIKQIGLASEIGTSLQQLGAILDDLEKDLTQFQITLVRKRGVGVSIHGSEMNKRELLSQLMMERLDSLSVYSVIEDHFVFQSITHERLPMIDVKEVFQVERLLMDDLDNLPYSLTESSYLNLLIHISLSIERVKGHEYVSIDQSIVQSVKDSLEFQVATSIANQLSNVYDVHLNTAEITFITIHLQSAKRKFEKSEDNLEDTFIAIHQLVQSVESTLKTHFHHRQALIEGLQLHITPALNRIQFNIETYNPMTQRIRQSYPLLFEAVKEGVSKIWPTYSFSIHEIAFLVLHFGGAMTKEPQGRHLLVVCSSGIGTSRILANRLYESFSNITNIKQISVGELNQMSLSDYDAIISTVDLDIDYPYLTVNPLLPPYEFKRTSEFLQQQFSKQQAKTNSNSLPNKSDTNIGVNDQLQLMKHSIQLADNIIIHQTDMTTNWATTIVELLKNHQRINLNEDQVIYEALVSKHNKQSFIISPYSIAIPHLTHNSIQIPTILIIQLETPIKMEENHDISTLLCAFLPYSSKLQPLMSNIYGSLALQLDQITSYETDLQLYELVSEEIVQFIKTI
ncbi:BglG family transcription antiterminator [Staphylococcus sp. 11261D007BR]